MTETKDIQCDERRVSPRYDRIVRVSYEFEGQRVPAVSLDIGPTGVYLLTQRVPAEGTQLALTVRGVRIDSPHITLVGEVVRVVREFETNHRRPAGTALRWVSASYDGPVEVLQQELKKLLGLSAVIATTDQGTALYRFPRAHDGAETESIRGTLNVGVPLRWHSVDHSGSGRLLAISHQRLSFEVLPSNIPPTHPIDVLVTPPREAVSEGIQLSAHVQSVDASPINPKVHCTIEQVNELSASSGFRWLIQTFPSAQEPDE